MVNLSVNEAPRWVVLGLWLAVNVVLFVKTYFYYRDAEEYYYLHELVGSPLCWARASAQCLNLNVMLILFPVCRKFISFIRGSCMCCPRSIRRQLDKNITYHKYIAYMICVMTFIHVSAHCFNFEKFAEAKKLKGPDIRNKLSLLPSSPNGTWINPIRTTDPEPAIEILKTVAGITGLLITFSLIIIISSSTEIIRRSYFELFWFTHHIFVVFFICFVFHGSQKIIHKQTNLKQHPPKVCIKDLASCPSPEFEGSEPTSWIWLAVPVFFYLCERVLRLISGRQRVVITRVVNHQSRVFELQMQKKGFHASPGQYILIQCPSLSKLEWHPFTLTSAPSDDYFSVHIRRVGDWTNDIAKLCHVDEGEFKEAWKMPKIYVDGPFGTATDDVFVYDSAVLVGCGIGVTPFASVLKSVWHKVSIEKDMRLLQSVDLFWVCPNTTAFEWFKDLLFNLERESRNKNFANFLRYNIYLTRGWDANQAMNIIMHDESSDNDAVTGLHQKTFYGRPQWDQVFKNLAVSYKGQKVGVFFCGPKSLSSKLHKLCNQYTCTEDGTKFYYNKENF